MTDDERFSLLDLGSPSTRTKSALLAKLSGWKGEYDRIMPDEDGIACCNQCKQPLIQIDNCGDLLTGCLSCNLWAASDEAEG